MAQFTNHAPVSNQVGNWSIHGGMFFGPRRDLDSSHPSLKSQRLVIGIDFGTTHTGVAYAFLPSNATILGAVSELKVVNTWGPRMRNLEKVPSVISYTFSPSGHAQWGANLSDDAVAVVNMKLELAARLTRLDELELTLQALKIVDFLSAERMKQSRLDPEEMWKTPEQIITDYMEKILRSFLQEAPHYNDIESRQFPTDIVITIPKASSHLIWQCAIADMPQEWPYEAQNSLFRAARTAGFNKTTFPELNDILLTTEPEAAFIYVERSLKENHGTEVLKPGECFVLCDAGGGTVDVTAFQVEQLDPLVFRQMSIPTSRSCGGSCINRSFQNWFREIVGRENYEKIDPENPIYRTKFRVTEGPELRRLMSVFEAQKNLFSNRSDTTHVDLQGPLEGLNIFSRVNNGQLSIEPREMRRFFDPCVNQIIELIEAQRIRVERENHRVEVFLVGGFGESPYLREELRKVLDLRRVTFRHLDSQQSWNAVAKGAVICGIEKQVHQNLKSGVPSSRNYGIVIDEPFSRNKSDPRGSRKDEASNEDVASKRFVWLIREGDLILSSEKTVAQTKFTQTSSAHDNTKHSLPIYGYLDEDEDVPQSWEAGKFEVDELGIVRSDLSHVAGGHFEQRINEDTGQISYTTTLTCVMRLTAEVLEVEVLVKDTLVGSGQIFL